MAARLSRSREALVLGWPGFGDEPADARIRGLEDLPGFVLQRFKGACDLVAQSMGGVVAMLIALRAPERVRRLVLCGTSGGLDLRAFDGADWRPDYLSELPETAPRWFVEDRSDLTNELGRITMPVLLIWGADDRVVSPAVGQMLAELLPCARLVILPAAGHGVAQE